MGRLVCGREKLGGKGFGMNVEKFGVEMAELWVESYQILMLIFESVPEKTTQSRWLENGYLMPFLAPSHSKKYQFFGVLKHYVILRMSKGKQH